MGVVRVANVRGLRSREQRAGVVYVGRGFAGWEGHPLANPFRVSSVAGRAAVLGLYRAWLLARPALAADLGELRAACGDGALPLGCWCHPLPCHADVLAELLNA